MYVVGIAAIVRNINVPEKTCAFGNLTCLMCLSSYLSGSPSLRPPLLPGRIEKRSIPRYHCIYVYIIYTHKHVYVYIYFTFIYAHITLALIYIKVKFPLDGLDLSSFCKDTAGVAAVHMPHKSSTDGGSDDDNTKATAASVSTGGATGAVERVEPVLYDLFAVCNHFGRLGYGHYTAVAREWSPETATLSDKWYEYDDDAVKELSDIDRDVVTNSAYILFYRRRT